MLPFAMSDEAVLTVSQLKKLLPFEKKVAVRRVEQYLQGNMPLFNKKVESNGLVSAAYLMLAYYWGLFWERHSSRQAFSPSSKTTRHRY